MSNFRRARNNVNGVLNSKFVRQERVRQSPFAESARFSRTNSFPLSLDTKEVEGTRNTPNLQIFFLAEVLRSVPFFRDPTPLCLISFGDWLRCECSRTNLQLSSTCSPGEKFDKSDRFGSKAIGWRSGEQLQGSWPTLSSSHANLPCSLVGAFRNSHGRNRGSEIRVYRMESEPQNGKARRVTSSASAADADNEAEPLGAHRTSPLTLAMPRDRYDVWWFSSEGAI